MIHRIEVTTAKVHDSQVDLANEGKSAMLIRDISARIQKGTMPP